MNDQIRKDMEQEQAGQTRNQDNNFLSGSGLDDDYGSNESFEEGGGDNRKNAKKDHERKGEAMADIDLTRLHAKERQRADLTMIDQ